MRNEAPREERVLQVRIRDGVIAYLRALFQSSGLFTLYSIYNYPCQPQSKGLETRFEPLIIWTLKT